MIMPRMGSWLSAALIDTGISGATSSRTANISVSSSWLEDSRKFQNEVSERLAEQVLHALYELLRGFQAAHDASKGELLRQPLAEHPDEVYRALLTVILRLVFLLYAEERDMGAAERAYRDAGGHKNEQNPADPYMTVLGYFNGLRELGGARRILEEEVQNTIKAYGGRKRIGDGHQQRAA